MIQNSTPANQVYTDINALHGIKTLGKQDKGAALMEVAKQFESMFVSMMMQSMRDASAVFEEDSLFGSPENDFYRDMYDSQLSLNLAGGQGLGLAPVIHRQLMSSYGDGANTPKVLDHGKLQDRRISIPLPSSRQLKDTMDEVDAELAKAKNASTDVSETLSSAKDANDIASGHGGKGQQFASPADFVAAVYPHAEVIGNELGVEPKAIVAQAALETGWGRYMITDDQGRNSFNFFGIKADGRWSGNKVEVVTHEYHHGVSMKERAAFRSYASMDEGLRDYANFLRSGERYQHAINNDLDGSEYGHALQRAGYATDPLYGDKIHKISRSDTLNDALQQLQQQAVQGVRNDG